MSKKRIEIKQENIVIDGKGFGDIVSVEEKVAEELVGQGYADYVSLPKKEKGDK